MLIAPQLIATATLAESDSTVKLVMFALFVLIWIIVAAAKAIAGLMKQVQQRAEAVRMAQAKMAPASRSASRPPQRQPTPPPQRASQSRKPPRAKKQKAGRPVIGVDPDETHSLLQPTAAATAHHEGGFDPRSIRALLTPAGIRSAYVYAEMLDPPPSARH